MPVNGRAEEIGRAGHIFDAVLTVDDYVTCVCRFRERGQEVRQLQRMAAGQKWLRVSFSLCSW